MKSVGKNDMMWDRKAAKIKGSYKFIFLTYISPPAACHKENEMQTGNTGLF